MTDRAWMTIGGMSPGLSIVSGLTPTSGYILHVDPANTGSITSSSGAVSQIDDDSGNAHHLTQSVGAQKLTTGTRTINGLNALDAVAANAQHVKVVFATAIPVTIIGVVKSDLTGVSNGQFVGNTPDGSTTSPTIYQETGNYAYYDGADQRSSTAVDTVAHVISVVFDTSGQMWLDGASIQSGNPNTNTMQGFALGASPQAGGSNGHDGLLGEWFVYPSNLSTGARQATEAFLKGKWGTP